MAWQANQARLKCCPESNGPSFGIVCDQIANVTSGRARHALNTKVLGLLSCWGSNGACPYRHPWSSCAQVREPVCTDGGGSIHQMGEGYTMPNQTAGIVATNLVDNFVSRFGCPRFIHTDQRGQFEGEIFKNMCARLGVEKTRTTPYHPASNGQVERYNRTLLGMLRCRCRENRER